MSCRKVAVPVAMAFLLPSLASATVRNPTAPKILLHLTHPTTKGILCDRGIVSDCTEAVVNGDLWPNGKSYFLYVEVYRGDLPDIAGLQLGIEYDPASSSGVDVFGWTYCLDVSFNSPGPFGPWPTSGSGNLMTWDRSLNCQTGTTSIAGYFYLAAYSDDVIQVVPRQVDSKAKVADCAARERLLTVSDLGRVAFSSGAATPGCNPCVDDCTTTTPQGNPIKPESVPTLPTTWSSVKSLFSRNS